MKGLEDVEAECQCLIRENELIADRGEKGVGVFTDYFPFGDGG